jgi:anti-sigma B factor antagonist
MLDLTSRIRGTVSVLKLSGRFDAYSAPAVVEWLEDVLETSAPNLVVDLGGVHFMDSTALVTLTRGMKHCRQRDGDLRLCSLQPSVRVIFELTRLDRAFEIYDDEDRAVESFDNV